MRALLLLVFATPLFALDWSTHGPVGGNVAQIAVSPAAPRVIYAGGGAGVYRSDDAGETWRDVSGPVHGVQLMAIDPTNAGIVYVTTGTDLYRTTDGGASWRNLASTFDLAVRPSALFVDPGNPTSVYLGSRCGPIGFKTAPSDSSSPFTGSGVFKSIDRGETWHGAANGLGGRYFSTCVEELSLDPATPQHLFTTPVYSDGGNSESYDFAASWTRADAYVPSRAIVADATLALTRYGITSVYSAGMFLRTTNGGISWDVVKTSGLPTAKYADLVLDRAAGRLFLATENGIFRSGDGGTNWADTGAPHASATRLAVAGDPGFLFAATATGVFRAPLSLSEWRRLELNDPSTNVTQLVADPRSSLRAFAVVLDYIGPGPAYDPVGRIFVTNDGGASWQLLRSGSGLGRANLAIDASGDLYVLDTGGLSRYSPQSGEWTPLTSPHTASIATDPRRAGVLFAFSVYSNSINVSTDGGVTWKSRSGPPASVRAIVADVTQSSLVYAVTSDGIYTTTDDSLTWTALTRDTTTLLAKSAASGTRMYRDGYEEISGRGFVFSLYRSDDAGATWTRLDFPSNFFVSATALAADPHNPDSVWAIVTNRVYHSTDAGRTWLDAGAPVRPVALAIAGDGSRVHLATPDHGVWSAAITISHRRAAA